MLEQQRIVAITRDNYHAFCKEKDLSKAEWAQWWEMCAEIGAGNIKLKEFVISHAEAEQAKSDSVAICQTRDWADMVHFHDTGCALKRAQLRAYEKWKGNKNE